MGRKKGLLRIKLQGYLLGGTERSKMVESQWIVYDSQATWRVFEMMTQAGETDLELDVLVPGS